MVRKLKSKSGKRTGSLRQRLATHQIVNQNGKIKKDGENGRASEPSPMIKKKKAQPNQTFIPFDQEDKVMLIGEGDFSFAKSIVESDMVAPENLIATSLDSLDDLKRKYIDKIDHTLAYLSEKKVVAYHEIDGQSLIKSLKMSEKDEKKNNKILNQLNINVIVFNFPHNGSGMKDMDRNIRNHQELMIKFFESCQKFFKLMRKMNSNAYLQPKQKIIVTLFEGEPYDSWGIKRIAKSFNYKVERSGAFRWDVFKSYHHRRTNGTLKDTSTPATQRAARIYVFEEAPPLKNAEGKDEYFKKDHVRRGESSDEE